MKEKIKTRTEKQIIFQNTFTFFNILNFILALLVVSVGSYRNMLFMGVIFSNIIIGSFQGVRSKRIMDKLAIITAPKATVIRNGITEEIQIEDIVMDDLICLDSGGQIPSDSLVVEGEVEVNESLITGESVPIVKKKGDTLLSGSFVISGKCTGKVFHVGEENYANKIIKDVGGVGEKYKNSEIMNSLDKLIKMIAISIVPIGLVMFWKQFIVLGNSIETSTLTTVASLISMIPEGLVLLTSIVFAVSVINLAKENTVVQELYCVESMARVDVLCLDKTGTITEGSMEVKEVIPFKGSKEDEIQEAVCSMNKFCNDKTPTGQAIMKKFGDNTTWKMENSVDFSSERKWRGGTFKEKGTFMLGAGEFILREKFSTIKEKVVECSSQGERVLLLAKSKEGFCEKSLPSCWEIEPIALIILEDKIRKDAKETLSCFAKDGVAIKIFSGDNPLTVANVAKKVGVENWDKYVDVSSVDQEKFEEILETNTVFGRVSPKEKLQFIKLLKKKGHTVAMIGDGANDVLALKEAHCSVAMASGSEAARCVSNLVLLDSNFSAVPKILAYGRCTINNLERTGSLFLVKTIYSMVIGLIFVFVDTSYPFLPIHLTLNSSLVIGIPSFFLAMEFNRNKVQGSFMKNIMAKAIPAAMTTILAMVLVLALKEPLGFTDEEFSTISVFLITVIGFTELTKITMPLNLFRGGILFFMILGGFLAFTKFKEIFYLTAITSYMAWFMIISLIFSVLIFIILTKLGNMFISSYNLRKKEK